MKEESGRVAELKEDFPSEQEGCSKLGFVRNEFSKKQGSRFSIICAFCCAGDGIVYVLRTQRNMKIHLVVAIFVLILGVVLSLDSLSWAIIVLCIATVIAAECFNTAVEAVVDLLSPGYHEQARRAKDCAAGSVLVCAFAAALVGIVIFGSRILLLVAD